MQTLIVSGELPGLNEVLNQAKKHWTEYRRLKDIYTMLSWIAAKKQLKPLTARARFDFTWYCKDRRRDPDNIASAKKFVFDGLIDAGILKNDGWGQVAALSDAFYVDAKNPRVEVEIRETIGE
jgi:Holliday junction resolvase RusA-like endonuclease